MSGETETQHSEAEQESGEATDPCRGGSRDGRPVARRCCSWTCAQQQRQQQEKRRVAPSVGNLGRAATMQTLASTAQHARARGTKARLRLSCLTADMQHATCDLRHALFMRCRGELAIPLLAAPRCVHHACATRDRGAVQRSKRRGANEREGKKEKIAAPAASVTADASVAFVRTMPVPGAARWRQQPAIAG